MNERLEIAIQKQAQNDRMWVNVPLQSQAAY